MLSVCQLKSSQRQVLDAMCDASTNVISTCCIVQAFGGCGKTKLLSLIAQERYARGLGCSLLITFSKDLKESLRASAQKQEGLVVENVHSLIRNVLYRGHNCVNEQDINTYLQLEQKPPLHPDFKQNINFVIFDEMQDMTPTFHKVVELVRSLLAPNVVSFLGVGDFFQAENAHIGSTPEFMTNARAWFAHERYLEFGSPGSFRLGHQMCQWINQNMDPRTIQIHFPECWAKYGERIVRYWGDGMVSHKCQTCDALHHTSSENCQSNILEKKHAVRILRATSACHYKTKSPLPVKADYFVKKNNAIILLNYRKAELYKRHYLQVTTPFHFKGRETLYSVVVGFDHFTERLCAQTAHDVDWPFVLYCQMLVSFTRASEQLIAITGSDQVPFFTMRKVSDQPLTILPLPKIVDSANKKRTRQDEDTKSRRSQRIAQQQQQYVTLQSVFAKMDTACVATMRGWIDVKSSACPALESMWVLTTEEQTHFEKNIACTMQDFCKRLVVTAAHTSMMCHANTKPLDWVHHLMVETKAQFSTNSCADATLASWCAKRAHALSAILAQYDSNFRFGVFEPFVFGSANGVIDMFTRFGCLFVCFEPSTNKLVLQYMTSFLCCKYRALEFAKGHPARAQLFMHCRVINLVTLTVQELELKVHSDFFLSHLNKTHKELFNQAQFSDIGLMLNQIPFVVDRNVFCTKNTEP